MDIQTTKTMIFQSTLPRRERQVSESYGATLRSISIHAPAKGATITVVVLLSVFVDFNPRSREGSDKCSTSNFIARCHFNPRSREGSDPIEDNTMSISLISIHAPAKGATITLPQKKWSTEFQSTLPRRERLFSPHPQTHVCEISIHAPAKGATFILVKFSPFLKFQSTLPRRERLYRW